MNLNTDLEAEDLVHLKVLFLYVSGQGKENRKTATRITVSVISAK
jgi:hypothetical protein